MVTASNEYTPTCAETANFSHKLLLTNTQVSSLHKAFANAVPASANVKNSKLMYLKSYNQLEFLVDFLDH